MKVIFLLGALVCLSSSVHALDCRYWWSKADPAVKIKGPSIDETLSANVMTGIECLLKLEGRKDQGVRFGSTPGGSQRVPIASVEVNALYTISELFYGDDASAGAIALIDVPPQVSGEFDTLVFNSDATVAKAFRSYRKWFERVKEIGLTQARRSLLDPLANSGVRWY
ncbi:MAG: hypothetical protein LC113_10625 [Acidobacteria bacterium]|nr:hypothetical protein [Acidobacteriota bacterium]